MRIFLGPKLGRIIIPCATWLKKKRKVQTDKKNDYIQKEVKSWDSASLIRSILREGDILIIIIIERAGDARCCSLIKFVVFTIIYRQDSTIHFSLCDKATFASHTALGLRISDTCARTHIHVHTYRYSVWGSRDRVEAERHWVIQRNCELYTWHRDTARGVHRKYWTRRICCTMQRGAGTLLILTSCYGSGRIE